MIEDDRETLRGFGFVIDDLDVQNLKSMSLCQYHIIKRGTPKIFSKEEIMKCMGYEGIFGRFRFRRLLNREFEVSYWLHLQLKKIGFDQYIWEWHDDLAGYP